VGRRAGAPLRAGVVDGFSRLLVGVRIRAVFSGPRLLSADREGGGPSVCWGGGGPPRDGLGDRERANAAPLTGSTTS
jgi:hypothetical protein